ncbi:MAG: hypothetical protein IJX42_00245 [Oscillospiraceae bacterium]|nr:hypothetical protein [Oscillospiraceae bacterium]MBQ8377551.1 hypothetical protein [Oscillospiraceae bacterium]
MNIVMISGLCVIASVLCKVLEKNTKEISVILSVITVALILVSLISKLTEINTVIEELFIKADINEQYGNVIMKSAGICYITHIGAQCCRDCSENGLASVVELAGKITVLSLSLPVIKNLITIIEGLLT